MDLYGAAKAAGLEPASAIPRFAQKHQFDIIVMGTIARTGVAGLFIGNTAEKVLRRVACSVLTLKPEGFLSPLQLRKRRDSELVAAV